jgi:hypothetical protein
LAKSPAFREVANEFFDGRYASARDINNQLSDVDGEIGRLASELYALKLSISERTDRLTVIRARAIGARLGVLIYALALIFLTGYSPAWALALGRLTNSIGFQLTI